MEELINSNPLVKAVDKKFKNDLVIEKDRSFDSRDIFGSFFFAFLKFDSLNLSFVVKS